MRNRSRFGWIELIEGILLIILGIFSFLRPDSMLSGFVMFFGLIALCIGILDIIFYVRTEEHVGFAPTIALMSGCLSVLAGLMLLVYPGAVKWAFSKSTVSVRLEQGRQNLRKMLERRRSHG